jgi:hypothetical protein
MSDDRPNMVAIIKAEMIWVALILLAIIIAFKIGVLSEKIGDLEDVVFNYGLYKQIEKRATTDE